MRRISEHNNQQSKYTSKDAPWIIVWYTTKESRSEAFRLERKLKNITSTKRVLQFIRNNAVRFEQDEPPVEDVLMRTGH